MHKYSPEQMSKFIEKHLKHDVVTNAAVFNTLRILKKYNPGDTYYEAYLGHLQKQGIKFVDYYHLLWAIGAHWRLDNIMEIGCRTGISICQLLSAMPDPKVPEVYLFDVFNDGFISPEVVKMNLRALNLPLDKIHFIVGDSLKTVPEKKLICMDYVLVDGCHEKKIARQDLENVVPSLAKAGLLFFDDLSKDGCDLIDVWDDFKKAHAEEFFFHENLDGKGIGIGVKR
jgi:hypothetical protein